MKYRNRLARRLTLAPSEVDVFVVNPFVSEAQRKACYAADDPKWDCGEWEAHTPKGKKLPKRKRKAPTTNTSSNPLRMDPSRTGTLRRVFCQDIRNRFNRLKGALVALVAKENAFGLTINTRFAFHSTPEQIKAFQSWLRTQVNVHIIKGEEDKLWKQYIEQGFRKGAGRAFDDAHKPYARGYAKDQSTADFYQGTKYQFLKDTFAQPVSIDRVKVLASRTFDDIKNVTDDMSTKISRSLTDGLVEGKSPRDIARDMEDDIDISRSRAETIARTEIIRAHAEGQLDGLEKLGVEQVGVAVEWLTVDPDIPEKEGGPCEACRDLAGVVLTIEEARNLLPRHPNCRCAFMPANVGEDDKDQVDTKASIQAAIRDSVERDGGPDKTTWAGADKDIDKKRPESIFNSVVNYNPDQERDASGRFGSGSGVGLLDRAKQYIGAKYSKLEERYGSKYAKAILAAAILALPVPIPGASAIASGIVSGVAEIHRAVSNELERKPTAAEFDREVKKLCKYIQQAFQVVNYSPDQPRDEHGRFGEMTGESKDKKEKAGSELESGGEAAHIAHEAHEMKELFGAKAETGSHVMSHVPHDFTHLDAAAIVARHSYGALVQAAAHIIRQHPQGEDVANALVNLHEGATRMSEQAVNHLAARYGHATAGAILGAGAVMSASVRTSVGLGGPIGRAIPGQAFIGSIPALALAETGKRLGMVGPGTKLESTLAVVGGWIHAFREAVGRPFRAAGSAVAGAGLRGAHRAGEETRKRIPGVEKEWHELLHNSELTKEEIHAEAYKLVNQLHKDFRELVDENQAGLTAITANVFCAGGEGSGVDPSCSPGDSKEVAELRSRLPDKKEWTKTLTKIGRKEMGEDFNPEDCSFGICGSANGVLAEKLKDKEPKLVQGHHSEMDKGYDASVHMWIELKDGTIIDGAEHQFRPEVGRGHISIYPAGSPGAKQYTPYDRTSNVFCPTGEGGGVDP